MMENKSPDQLMKDEAVRNHIVQENESTDADEEQYATNDGQDNTGSF